MSGGPRIVERLHAALREPASRVAVDRLVLGLGYTAVVLEGGGAGLAYTWSDDRSCCSHLRAWDGQKARPPPDFSICFWLTEGWSGASGWRRRTP